MIQRHVGCSLDEHMRVERIAEGVPRLRTLIVNSYLVADSSGAWVLVDTG